MRRRLRNLLPIVLLALLVQIFAPISACRAVSVAASDPLAGAVICHGSAAQEPGQDQTGQHVHDCCVACSSLQTGALIDARQASATIVVDRQMSQMAWQDRAPGLFGSRTASEAQARAPPFLS
ncbi:DUF2946 family protein [Bradyrhizobium sp. ORS 86]|uniref:DUF2946 family protein n=1 Tax=Bradyrhizobium sp. ORS 86 TaxID=1685970 RepID=UPI00388E67E6